MSQPPSRLNPGAFTFVPGQNPRQNQPSYPQQQQQQGQPGEQNIPGAGGQQYPYGGQNPPNLFPAFGGAFQQSQYGPPTGQGGYPGAPYGGYPSSQQQAYTPPHLRQQQQQQWQQAQQPYGSPDPLLSRSSYASPQGDRAPIEREPPIPAPPPTIKPKVGGTSTSEKTAIDPPPGKTIKLNIGGGGSKEKENPPLAPAVAPAAPSAKPAANTIPKPVLAPATASGSGPSSTAATGTNTPVTSVSKSAKGFDFTSDKSKTSADAVLHDTLAVADQETLKDLYGDGEVVDPNVKSHVNIVFVGHVDAGKSTLGGQILFLTESVDKRTMEKYEREAKEAGRETWYLSWALDSTTQERSKGKTVEVGRAYFETSARRYTVLDAPGHKTYVPSMISGAAQADVAILVISARKGEFETGFEKGGQTREHIMLVKTAGVGKLIIVINKMDDPTVMWAQERFKEIKDKLAPFVRSAGFNVQNDIQWIPISGYTGVNVKDRVTKKVAPWWTGPSLLEQLDSVPLVDRKINGPVMLPISEKYKDLGTVVVGKLESGRTKKGDSLLMMPNKVLVEVSAIYSEAEDEVNYAFGGDNVRIRLRGVEDEDVSPGFMLTSPGKPVHAVRRFEAQLAILDHKNIICAGYSAIMHVHTLAEEVQLTALLHYFDKKTGRKSKKPPQFAKKGQKIIARIETTAPICLERFADYPQLGRFTLRDEGKTVAIGKVTKLLEGDVASVIEGVANIALNGPSAAAPSADA